MQKKMLLEVAESFLLPGLGLLLLPAGSGGELQILALHTALEVTLHRPGGPQAAAVVSVEEITRPGQVPVRALLLAQEGTAPVPAGTEVWGTGQEAGWEELLGSGETGG